MGEQRSTEMTEGRAADHVRVWNDDFTRELDLPSDLSASQNVFQASYSSATDNSTKKDKNTKHRFGLPSGFVSRLNRYGRTVLFEDNVYRLPNGLEFIPQPPSGPLGFPNHQYALVSLEQFESGKRGSVYVHTDGRIFDYSFDHSLAERELFDTGFTIHDLERTGAYAPPTTLRARRLRQRAPAVKRKKKTRTGKKRKSGESLG